MDFGYLIELAKANEERDRKDSSIKFSTCVPNAKKVAKAGPKVDAIKKILSQKEQDKKKEDEEYREKRAKLLALRAQDKKSNKRVLAMINRTKGASKSVLEDAKDITTAVGEEQCDEDDYGYESTFSQQIFAKLKTNYSEIPEDERLKFNKTKKSDINDIKSRVLSSLKQEQEEDLGIRKRKRNRKKSVEEDGFINDGDVYNKFDNDKESIVEESGKKAKRKSKSESKIPVNLNITNYKSDKYSQFKYKKDGPNKEEKSGKEEKKKKNKIAPPPLSFEQLMKVAVNKVSQPLPVDDPLEILKKKKKEREKELENERPLTAKEKKELAEEKLRKLKQAWKLSGADKEPAELQKLKSELEPKSNGKKDSDVPSSKGPKPDGKKLYDALTAKPLKDKSRFFAVPASVSKPNMPKNNSNTATVDKTKPVSLSAKNSNKTVSVQNSIKKSDSSPIVSKKEGITAVESSKIVNKAPTSSSNKSLPFPPKFPVKKPSSLPLKRRIDSDEESDYDSEMDDFIDDGDVDMDYSSEIAKMFNYDKNKYRGMDEDIDDMEASYTQVEKEERISAKLGLKEDLEDLEREEMEKKRKMMLMKSKGKLKR